MPGYLSVLDVYIGFLESDNSYKFLNKLLEMFFKTFILYFTQLFGQIFLKVFKFQTTTYHVFTRYNLEFENFFLTYIMLCLRHGV